jgi:hypothetical protein
MEALSKSLSGTIDLPEGYRLQLMPIASGTVFRFGGKLPPRSVHRREDFRTAMRVGWARYQRARPPITLGQTRPQPPWSPGYTNPTQTWS